MKRRNALKNMATAVAGLVSLPTWAANWHPDSLRPTLGAAANDLLAELVEVIIPATDTPGAKSLGVNLFVQKMITDCYDKAAQGTLTNGLTLLDKLAQDRFSLAFTAISPAQRLELVQGLAASQEPAQKTFLSLVKGLTIRGYTTSEYVMTNIAHFQLAPGFYKGCVPVTPKPALSTSTTKSR